MQVACGMMSRTEKRCRAFGEQTRFWQIPIRKTPPGPFGKSIFCSSFEDFVINAIFCYIFALIWPKTDVKLCFGHRHRNYREIKKAT